ncbi:hypothetical protein [Lachnoclostridium phytofermentans]|nr:hypothetical protein [Lachnoclostridium phytofermentans]
MIKTKALKGLTVSIIKAKTIAQIYAPTMGSRAVTPTKEPIIGVIEQ